MVESSFSILFLEIKVRLDLLRMNKLFKINYKKMNKILIKYKGFNII